MQHVILVRFPTITMAPRTGKRPKAASINPSAVEDAAALLEGLPEKQKESFSLREAVSALQDQIKTALAKGYTYDDVAQMLAKRGIEISASTLKNYVPSGKRQARTVTPRVGRGRIAKAVAAEEAEVAVAPAAPAPEVVKVIKRGRPGRAAAAAVEKPATAKTSVKAKAAAKATPGRRGRKPRAL
jgi:hypothetical protein